jgi:hypothetical protein
MGESVQGVASQEVLVACREALQFSQLLARGQARGQPRDLLDLAQRAVEQCAARAATADVQAWADRLAQEGLVEWRPATGLGED